MTKKSKKKKKENNSMKHQTDKVKNWVKKETTLPSDII